MTSREGIIKMDPIPNSIHKWMVLYTLGITNVLKHIPTQINSRILEKTDNAVGRNVR